jgi:hypothetical protein
VALNGHKIIHFAMEKTIKVISWDRYLVHKSLISAEFVSDRMSYIILKRHWCNIIVLNVHAPCEIESNDVRNSFYKETGRVSEQFPTNNIKFCLVISMWK